MGHTNHIRHVASCISNRPRQGADAAAESSGPSEPESSGCRTGIERAERGLRLGVAGGSKPAEGVVASGCMIVGMVKGKLARPKQTVLVALSVYGAKRSAGCISLPDRSG